MLLIILSFILGLITDIIWSRYFSAINKQTAFYAANYSIGIVLCGLFASWLLIDKEWAALVAYIVGGYIGTYLAVRMGKTRD